MEPPQADKALLTSGTAAPGRKSSMKGMCAQFLRHNPRFVNEPICHVLPNENSASVAECMQWRAAETHTLTQTVPHSQDSTSRSDYQPPTSENRPSPLSQHHPAPPPTGIAPLINEQPVKVKEHISYRHQYNSRTDPNEPISGKLHGSFVWEVTRKDANSSNVIS